MAVPSVESAAASGEVRLGELRPPAAEYCGRQLVRALALRAVADGRWDERSREGGRPDPNSGGWVLFLGGDVLVSPAQT
jgi:hypothetical protein